MPRLTQPLPVLNHQDPIVQGDGEGLVVFLAPVNDPWIQARIGDERVREEPGRLPGCRVTEGEKFKSPAGGSQQGRRYLWTLNGQDAVGALNVTLKVEPGRRKPIATVSNIFVHPDHRRQGLANAMIERARQDFAGLTVDAAMSTAGAALFLGQVPTPAPLVGLDTPADAQALTAELGSTSAPKAPTRPRATAR